VTQAQPARGLSFTDTAPIRAFGTTNSGNFLILLNNLRSFRTERISCPALPAAEKDAAARIDTARYVDTISAEDAMMNAKLKNICRGC